MDNNLLTEAQGYEKECNWEKSAKIYCELITDKSPTSYYEKAAWCLSRAAKYNDALKYLMILCEKEPACAKWSYMVGYQYYCQKNWNEAIKWFEKSLDLKEDYFVVKYRIAYAYVQIAGEYKKLTKSEYWKALGHLQDCDTIWENYNDLKRQKEMGVYFDINFLHGKMLMGLPNKRLEAVSRFMKSLEIKPNDEFCKYNLSKTYYLMDSYDLAKENLPSSNQYYVVELSAHIDAKLCNYDQAISKIDRLTKKRKKDYLFCFLANIYIIKNDLPSAYNMIQKAISMGKDNHKNYFTMGKLFYKAGLLIKALECLNKAQNIWNEKYNLAYDDCLKLHSDIDSILALTPDYKDDSEFLKKLALQNTDQNKMHKSGCIKSYKTDKGFGFIKSKDEDIFFHISNCEFKEIEIGCKVVFETEINHKGMQAVKIVKL